MKKKPLILLFLFFTLFQANGFAQSPDKILKKATKALGGEAKLRGVKSRQTKGTITRVSDGAQGSFQSRTTQPNLYTEFFDLDGFELQAGFNGKSGWTRDSKNGLRTLTDNASRNFQAETNYRNNRWLNYKNEKSKIAFAGTILINGKKADVVTLTTAKNVKLKISFDSITNLPIREEIPSGSETKIFDYGDYRTVNGINEPFSITQLSENEKYVVKLNQVTHSQTIAKSLFDFPRISDEPLPDVSALLKQVEANEDKVDEILENYTYTETQIKREAGADGTMREKEVEKNQITFYKGHQIRRLISKNGKPLSPDEADKEDKKAVGYIADIDNKISKKAAAREAAHAANEPIGGKGERIPVSEILRASNLINPRRERFRDRDVIVFDFEPNPNFDYSNAKSLLKFFGKTAGAIWIDEQAKQVARVEAALVDNFKVAGGVLAKVKKGASFTLEQNRINDEIWLPSTADINVSVKVLLVKEFNVNQNVKFSDYQRFKSEVKDAKVDDAKKP